MLVIPSGTDFGAQIIFTNFLDNTIIKYHLFKNDITPDLDTVVGSLDEATFSGYEAVTVDPFPFDEYDAQQRAVFLADEIVFEADDDGDAQEIYGYYVTTDDDETLLWLERFGAGPYTIEAAGEKISFRPRITFRSESPYICVT